MFGLNSKELLAHTSVGVPFQTTPLSFIEMIYWSSGKENFEGNNKQKQKTFLHTCKTIPLMHAADELRLWIEKPNSAKPVKSREKNMEMLRLFCLVGLN